MTCSSTERAGRWQRLAVDLLGLSEGLSVVWSAENLADAALAQPEEFAEFVREVSAGALVEFHLVRRDPYDELKAIWTQWGFRMGLGLGAFLDETAQWHVNSRGGAIDHLADLVSPTGALHVSEIGGAGGSQELTKAFGELVHGLGIDWRNRPFDRLPRVNPGRSLQMAGALRPLEGIAWDNENDNARLSLLDRLLGENLGLLADRSGERLANLMRNLVVEKEAGESGRGASSAPIGSSGLAVADSYASTGLPRSVVRHLMSVALEVSAQAAALRAVGIADPPSRDSIFGGPSLEESINWTRQNRRKLARHMTGAGLEMGPGVDPFPVDSSRVTMTFLEKPYSSGYAEAQHLEAHDVKFDGEVISADLDKDDFTVLVTSRFDFIVASHVLEHVANPLRVLEQAQGVLVDGGKLILVLPDLRFTFDRARTPTGIAHLAEHYRDGTDYVDRAHILEVLMSQGVLSHPDELTREREEELRYETVHAHAWTWVDFCGGLPAYMAVIGANWSLLDLSIPELALGRTNEFAVVLVRDSTCTAFDLADQILTFVAPLEIGMDVKARLAWSLRCGLVTAGLAEDTASLGNEPEELLWALYCVWSLRSDLRTALPNPIWAPGGMLGWAFATRESEAQANMLSDLLVI
jgi:hypothetical protein